MRALVGILSLSLLACSAAGRGVGSSAADAAAPTAADAGASSRPKDADAAAAFDPDADAPQGCERDLEVGALTLSSNTCFVNEHVQNQSGKLRFPCKGGDASVEFAGKTFEGTVKGDVISLRLVEPFMFNGCQWQSTETIKGDLSTNTLVYTYVEKKLANCTDTPCTADGDLAVSSGAVVVVK